MSNKNDCETKHTGYLRRVYSRRSVRDSIDGSDSVKRAAEVYLPMPSGMAIDNTAPNITRGSGNMGEMTPTGSVGNNAAPTGAYDSMNAPYYHSNPAYRSYLQRARFPEITSHALRGLVGTATRIPLDINISKKLEYLKEAATSDGMTIHQLYAELLSEVLQGGNVSLVVEVNPKTNKPYFIVYVAETAINWDIDIETSDLKLCVFETIERDENNENIFDTTATVSSCLVYNLDENGAVVQTKFLDGEETGKKESSLQGSKFKKIPVVYMGAVRNDPYPQTPPLLGISEIAYTIYRKDADLSQAEYMTCNPNLVITGLESDAGIPMIFGSTVALILPDPDSKAFYPETDTSALDHVSKSIQSLFEEAMMYGASLSGPAKKGVESTETVVMRGNNQGATLVGMVKNVAEGLEKALVIAGELMGVSERPVITPSLEFAQKSLSPQMLTALIQAWSASGLSKQTLLRNLKEAGILSEDEDIKVEMARIESEGPASDDGIDETPEQIAADLARQEKQNLEDED